MIIFGSIFYMMTQTFDAVIQVYREMFGEMPDSGIDFLLSGLFLYVLVFGIMGGATVLCFFKLFPSSSAFASDMQPCVDKQPCEHCGK